MFDKIFVGKGEENPVDKEAKEDGLSFWQVAEDILEDLLAYYKTDYGVHIETLLSSLGALSGFGCQMAVWDGFIKSGELTEREAFEIVTLETGETFYYGDYINQPLLSAEPFCVWSIVAGGAQTAGAQVYPDVIEIVESVTKRLGTNAFWIPRLPDEHMPHELPLDALNTHWDRLRPVFESNGIEPYFWSWIYATAAQKAIIMGREVLAPELACKIVMEAAIPMSKVDPARVKGAL